MNDIGVTNKNEINENVLRFLLEEFNQCFAHMRHYDNIKLSLIKFIFSFYSVIATLSFTLERYFYYEHNTKSVDMFLGIIFVSTFFMGFVIIIMLIQNRKYFIRVARQVNSIRGTFLGMANEVGLTFENFLDADASKPVALNIRSTHLLLIYILCMANSVFLSFAGFFMLRYFVGPILYSCLAALFLFILSLAGEVVFTRITLEGG